MSSALVLALLMGQAAPDALGPAQDAFARRDYPAAEALALAAARPPLEGAALYLAGLARFRAGHPEPALAALDAAGQAADPPPRGLWQFNRGACLYQLGRLAEAEAAFLEAAEREPAVATAALVNAGFAALDAGAPERARTLAGRARAGAAAGPAAELVADLERHLQLDAIAPGAAEAHAAGLAAFDAGRFAEARAQFQRAVALDPHAAASLAMAGASALRLGARSEARAELARALTLPLDPADARQARASLEAASEGLASRGLGWEVVAQAGVGVDDNVLQSGLASGQELAPVSSGRVRSPFLSVGGALAHRARLGPTLVTELAWGLDQVVYTASAAADYGLQQHLATAALEVSPRDRLRLGVAAQGQLAFTGRADFRGLLAAGGLAGWAAVDWSDATSSRLDLEVSRKLALRSEFEQLAGQRLELTLGQTLRLPPLSLGAGLRLRAEQIGTLVEASAYPVSLLACGFGCSQRYLIPFGHRSVALTLTAQAPLGARAWLVLSTAWERRRYAADSVLWLVAPDGEAFGLDRRRRRDDRLSAAVQGRLRLTPHLALGARYDVARSWSNVARVPAGGLGACTAPDFSCHALDYDEKNYLRQTAGLEAVLAW